MSKASVAEQDDMMDRTVEARRTDFMRLFIGTLAVPRVILSIAVEIVNFQLVSFA
jgi:hypothetical protein